MYVGFSKHLLTDPNFQKGRGAPILDFKSFFYVYIRQVKLSGKEEGEQATEPHTGTLYLDALCRYLNNSISR